MIARPDSASAGVNSGPFRKERPSVIVQVGMSPNSGPANPSTPESSPYSSSKIAPLSS
jgi:hypothetical protein